MLRLVVNGRALRRALDRARRDPAYDVRGSALVVWPPERTAPLGLISWEWDTPAPPFVTVHRVEAAEGLPPAEVLAHLHRLLEADGPLAPGDEYA